MSQNPEKKFLTYLIRPQIKPYLWATIFVGFTLLQSIFDPFGLASSTDRLSGLLISNVLSPFYGGDEHTGRENVLVVLYDEKYFSQYGDWPVPPEQHFRLLERIAGGNPAAVFLDVYFTAQNQERKLELRKFYENLQQLDCADSVPIQNCIDNALAPIFLASVVENLDPAISIEKPQGLTVEIRPPRVALAEVNLDEYLYRLRECIWQDNEKCLRILDETAGYKLYQQWCARQKILQRKLCPEISADSLDAQMYLQWGYAPSNEFADFYNTLLQQEPNGEVSACQRNIGNRFWTSIKLAVSAALQNIALNRSPCPYHNYVGAKYLMEINYSELEKLVKNKVVLVGATDQKIPDRIESHVHGYLPGVFWHAAAVDNLIQGGDNFLRKAPEKQSLFLEGMAAFLLFFGIAFFISQTEIVEMRIGQHHSEDSKQFQLIGKMYIAIGALALASTPTLICLFWIARNYSPENWVGTAGLLSILCAGPIVALRHSGFNLTSRLLNDIGKVLTYSLAKLTHDSMGLLNFIERLTKYIPLAIPAVLRVILFLIVFLALSVLTLLAIITVFFVPIIVVSLQTQLGLFASLVILGYLLLAIALVLYWWRNRKTLPSEIH